MQRTYSIGKACLAASIALLATSATAEAAPKRIQGKLSKPGYTVIALAADGEGDLVRAKPGFSIRPPSTRVSLHLRAPDGTYAGPIVIGTERDGRRAILGVKVGAKLGQIEVRAQKGFAKLSDEAPEDGVDDKRWARAENGVPTGSGNFGLVRSKVPRGSPPGDLDADGVADPLDIDDDGDLVLDRYEPTGAATVSSQSEAHASQNAVSVYTEVLEVNADGTVHGRACGIGIEATLAWPADAPAPIVGKVYLTEVVVGPGGPTEIVSATGPIPAGCAQSLVPKVTPGLGLTLRDTVNANATALTQADFDATLAQRGFLLIQAPATEPGDAIELDCGGNAVSGGWSGGLSYCTPGGTGLATPLLTGNGPPRSWPLAFPSCCDADANGDGELEGLESESGTNACFNRCVNAFFSPGATPDQIGTGDVLNWRVDVGAVEGEFPTTLQDVFATVPALVAYADGAGNSAAVSYPVPPPYVGSPSGFLTDASPDPTLYQGFPVAACPPGAPPPCVEGDVVVGLQFWRPQREAIPGAEVGQWTDIGGLVYAPGAAVDNNIALPNCDAGHLSTTNPRLTPAQTQTPFSSGAGFRDSSPDQPANPANTLSFAVNLSQCLGRPLESGEKITVWLGASLGRSVAEGTSGSTQQLLFTVE